MPVDASVLFSRLIIVLQRQTDIQPLFSHELTALPSAFFKDKLMRKADKSVLAKHLTSTTSSCELEPPIGHSYVVDGGWLLHKGSGNLVASTVTSPAFTLFSYVNASVMR